MPLLTPPRRVKNPWRTPETASSAPALIMEPNLIIETSWRRRIRLDNGERLEQTAHAAGADEPLEGLGDIGALGARGIPRQYLRPRLDAQGDQEITLVDGAEGLRAGLPATRARVEKSTLAEISASPGSSRTS